ncbi:hypothetical protein [Chelativorans alearense]|uniref:hypothetical protein n=1 Tax=Chelativorans alearense TaxID=2681495 RepID=UPI001FEC1A41|nr:hypothetical protein [Chelativorans alearense]
MHIPTSSGAVAAILATLCGSAFADTGAAPANFLYTSSGSLEGLQAVLERPDIDGVQIVYSWKSLEPGIGQYDFSAIERDLATAEKLGKKLFIQVQDRFFSPKARNVPAYLTSEPQYGGGLVAQVDNAGEGEPVGHGWAAMQWNDAVRGRFQALIEALAEKFDGRVFGINLPETAVDIDMEGDRTGFTCDAYFEAEMDNLAAAQAAFTESHVVQYVNFWPCEWANDHDYMGRLFEYAADHGVGLGGPDIVPYRKGQMKNAYPFFNRYKGKLGLVAMAVQEPTLTYTNPKTGRPFTKDEFVGFASDYLGVDVIFWSAESPWLKG